MTRSIFALVLITGFLLNETFAADPPSGGNESATIIERLDQILRRLEAIELRLTQLELESRLNQEWWVDERGVMRTSSGRPIGFWGIDGPATQRRH
jgi:hypothetical protein